MRDTCIVPPKTVSVPDMAETYSKLFSSILGSSIWGEDDQTRIVWITMLAMKDRDGYVGASVPGLARLANVPLEAVQRALATFLAPDKHSRSADFEGRRIEVADRGWIVLNHERFRDMRDEDARRAYERDRKRAQRAARNVPDSPAVSAHADADADADAEVGPSSPPPTRCTVPGRPDGADASHGGHEGGGTASPPDGTDPAMAITDRLVSLGWRSASNRFVRLKLVRSMVDEQGITLEAIDKLWRLASERAKDPIALLATWLDRAQWKDVLAEQAMKNKQAVQRRAPTNDDIGPIYGDPKPISDLIGGALP